MVTLTEQWIEDAEVDRVTPSPVDRRVRAALVTAMALGVPLLHEHLSRTLAVDIFGPEGDRLVARGLLAIYSHELIDDRSVGTAVAGLAGADPDFIW